jgi:hypothetical protein
LTTPLRRTGLTILVDHADSAASGVTQHAIALWEMAAERVSNEFTLDLGVLTAMAATANRSASQVENVRRRTYRLDPNTTATPEARPERG